MLDSKLIRNSRDKEGLDTHTQTSGVVEGNMSVVGHLREIKSRLVWIIISFATCAIICSVFVESIVREFIKKGGDFNFVYISPSELVTCYVRIVLTVAIVLASPIIIYQIWGFVRPALEQNERRMGLISLLGGLLLFAAGVAFCYFIVVPFTIYFFVNFNSTGLIEAQISFENYISFLLTMLFTFGLIFEMPVLIMFLSQLGLIKPEFLIKTRKFAILIIFVLGAVLTPPDVVSQLAVAVPMLALYEISILVCKAIVGRKQARIQADA